VLKVTGLEGLFEEVVDGLTAEREDLAGKPAPDMFLFAARCLHIPPAKAAVFEDALAGVEAGHAGGFGFVVGVDRAGQAEELHSHGGDIVVSDLADLLAMAPGGRGGPPERRPT
jgi:beta-phosphoglucomutase-like phosphatase (HAD superfamily)